MTTPSNIPGLEYIIGHGFANVLGPDTTLIGLFAMFVFLIFWAYSGAGFEAGVIIFGGLAAFLVMTGFLPSWVGFILALALGLLALKLFAAPKW